MRKGDSPVSHRDVVESVYRSERQPRSQGPLSSSLERVPWFAAGHVSARFLRLKGGAGKLKFVSAMSFPTEPSRGVEFVTLPLWIGKNHSEGIVTFDIRVQYVAFS